jgi:exonuclease III
MRILVWHIGGFGRRGHRTQLKEYIIKEKIDVVCLQETIKLAFIDQELKSLEPGEAFHWSWVPANGHFGGYVARFQRQYV